MQDIRIAAVIFNSAVNHTQNNLDRMVPWIKLAKSQAAQLICFPELNVTGYSTKPGIESCAESIPGPISRQLQRMAHDHQIAILAGMVERDQKGRIYASHLVATPKDIAGSYRKIHIAPPERNIFSPGNAVPLFDYEVPLMCAQLDFTTESLSNMLKEIVVSYGSGVLAFIVEMSAENVLSSSIELKESGVLTPAS